MSYSHTLEHSHTIKHAETDPATLAAFRTWEHLRQTAGCGQPEQLRFIFEQPLAIDIALKEDVIVQVRSDSTNIGSIPCLNLKRFVEAAARAGKADNVELLLEIGRSHGVQLEGSLIDEETMVAVLKSRKRLDVIQKMFGIWPDCINIRPNNRSILRPIVLKMSRATEKERMDFACFLLDRGIDLGPDLPTVLSHHLYEACYNGTPGIISLLVERGAVIHGSCATHAAAAHGRIKSLEVLLGHGADLNELCPLFYQQALRGCTYVAGSPYSFPARTPLHVAVSRSQRVCVEWLLAHGANEEAIDSEGLSVRELAEASGNHEICDILNTVRRVPSEDLALEAEAPCG